MAGSRTDEQQERFDIHTRMEAGMSVNSTTSPREMPGKRLRRLAIAGIMGVGASFAIALPAQAASSDVPSTLPAPYGRFEIASQPSQHCGYYHWIYNGANIGSGYRCSTNASLKTYHVWNLCSDGHYYSGPPVSKGNISAVDCSPYRPKTGGIVTDS